MSDKADCGDRVRRQRPDPEGSGRDCRAADGEHQGADAKVVALAPDYRVVISHGNGPQVGNLLLQQEATTEVAEMPVPVLGAMTQGQIGYMMEAALERSLAEAGLERNFLTVITMVEVDRNDPLFKNPTKPIGPFYTDEEAAKKTLPDGPHRQGHASGDRLADADRDRAPPRDQAADRHGLDRDLLGRRRHPGGRRRQGRPRGRRRRDRQGSRPARCSRARSAPICS